MRLVSMLAACCLSWSVLAWAAILAGVIVSAGCQQGVTTPSTIPDWYPSTIEGYTPYRISVVDGDYAEFLKPGQTRLTEEEVIRYTKEFIDQRRDHIGADSNSLRLIEVKNTGDSLRQAWSVGYAQIRPYKLRIGGWRYGVVWFSIIEGRIVLFESTTIPEVPVPDRALVSNEMIYKHLMGYKILFDAPIGPYKDYTITTATEFIFKDLVIVPKLTGETLEIRLGREVEIIARDFAGEWAIFYDVITDEVIKVIQLFDI